MTQQLMEGILDALQTYFAANLDTKIAAINTRNSDSLLSVMGAITSHEAIPEKFPILEMLGVKTEPIRETDSYFNGLYTVNFRFTVVCEGTTSATGPELVSTMIWRYHLAIVEILQEARSDAAFANIPINIGVAEFSDVFQSDEEFVKTFEMECTFNRTEAK